MRRIRIQPVVDIVADPLADAEAVVDALDGRPVRSAWMERLRGGGTSSGPVTASQDGVIRYAGRDCCYQHLSALEQRRDLRPPFDTTCGRCQRRFRVRMGAVDTDGGRTWDLESALEAAEKR